VIFRNSRSQKLTVSRFWILPLIVLALTALGLWSTVAVEHADLVATIVSVVIGIALGVPLGIARGHHSKVRLGETPGTLYVDPSLMVTLIWLAAFVLKYVVNTFLPNAGPIAVAATDGFLLFGVTSILVARLVIFRKYEALRAGQAVANT
jgi:ABC-type antimicrobial peptide transport system permease subunit